VKELLGPEYAPLFQQAAEIQSEATETIPQSDGLPDAYFQPMDAESRDATEENQTEMNAPENEYIQPGDPTTIERDE
jgi:hypothetical protein